MKHFLLLALAHIFLVTTSFSQNSESLYLKSGTNLNSLSENTPIVLQEIRENDILYSWTVYRVIDLSQKLNMPLVHPRSSLINLLIDAVKSGQVEPYLFSSDDFEASSKLSSQDVIKSLEKYDTISVTDPVTYKIKTSIIKVDFNPDNVVQFRLKERWVFDRRTASMVVRILGIAPVQNVTSDGSVIDVKSIFWLYFPPIRPLLARNFVFNFHNESARMTFDDFFLRRSFSSYIYKEPNVKDLRVQDYAQGEDFLLESERIKRKIFDFEQSLWDY